MTLSARLLVSALLGLGAIVGACSLNPQPLPPDNPDGATLGADADKGPYDTGAGFDGAGSEDAADGSPAPGGGDAEAGDASDAGAIDAESDSETDARDD